MKRIVTISIALIYFVLSIGIAKSTHFCMGRALPSTVFSFESKKCGCAELESPDNCCDDQLELVKIENDQSAGPVIHLPAPDFNFICELFFEQPKENSQRPSFEFAVAHDLPPPKIPIYQRICSLVFYESVI